MERKTWVMPMTLVQKFEANETVSACWGVACNTTVSNQYEKDHGNEYLQMWMPNYKYYISHDANDCGAIGNQYVIDEDLHDGVPPVMYEYVDGNRLPCTFTDSAFNPTQITTVTSGQTIYWITSQEIKDGWPWPSQTATWHHQGQAVIDPRHPNRS